MRVLVYCFGKAAPTGLNRNLHDVRFNNAYLLTNQAHPYSARFLDVLNRR